eukprot:m.210744 g.210744  ORF g.210744 m.210744 type:complete len:208 (-) comp25494_c0_seq6:106-729(-)
MMQSWNVSHNMPVAHKLQQPPAATTVSENTTASCCSDSQSTIPKETSRRGKYLESGNRWECSAGLDPINTEDRGSLCLGGFFARSGYTLAALFMDPRTTTVTRTRVVTAALNVPTSHALSTQAGGTTKTGFESGPNRGLELHVPTQLARLTVGVCDHERACLCCNKLRGHHQVPFILPAFIVHHHHEFPLPNRHGRRNNPSIASRFE